VSNSPQYVVSIHLGASAFSLLISQLIGEKSEQIEYLEQPIPLARDIFSAERVRRDTIERCVEILDRFLLLIKEFELSRDQITTCAVTNIIHEAKNHHVILNRLEVASGLKFIALDNGGMTRLIFQKFQRHQLTASFNSPGKTLAAHADYAEMTEDERIRAFHLDYHSEDAFLPALQINLGLLRGFNCQQYWIPPTEYERGLLMDLPLTQSRTHHFAEETLPPSIPA